MDNISAAVKLGNLLAERFQKDGIAWYTPIDLNGATGADAYSIARLSTRTFPGEKVKWNVETADIVLWMLRWVKGVADWNVEEIQKAAMGVFTDATTRLIVGARIKVQNILGVAKAPKEDSVIVPGHMNDALNMMKQVEALNKRMLMLEEKAAQVESDKLKVKAELEVYKPAIAAMAALQQSVARVHANARQQVTG